MIIKLNDYYEIHTLCPRKNVFCLRVYCGSMIDSKELISSILAGIYIEI